MRQTRIGLFVFGVVLGVLSCRTKDPEMATKAVSCTAQAVSKNWARAYPYVQTCLSVAMASPLTCLDALPSVLSTGLDVIACIVRSSGQEAASQAAENPNDIVSTRRLERAKAWLDTRGIEFR